MIAFLRRLVKRYGFSRETHDEWTAYYRAREDSREAWLSEQATISKARRLAQIARERDALKEKVAKAKRDKKAVSPFYKALRALSVEELRIESGK